MAQALKGLQALVGTFQPQLILGVDDDASPVVRAATTVARLTSTPLLQLPVSAPSWAVSSLGALTLSQLRRWTTVRLTIAVVSGGSVAALEAMRGAITQVALVGDAPHLHVLLPADASVATVAAAQAWPWPRVGGGKRLSFRVSTVPTSVGLAEAWSPTESDSEALLLLSADAHLSPALYVYAKHFVLGVSSHKVLGVDLGTAGTDAGAGFPELKSSCGALYLPHAWLELQEYISAKFKSTGERDAEAAARTGGSDVARLSWAELLGAFMQERDYLMHRPVGAPMCRVGNGGPRFAESAELMKMFGLPSMFVRSHLTRKENTSQEFSTS